MCRCLHKLAGAPALPHPARVLHGALPFVTALALVASALAGIPVRVAADSADPPVPVVAIHVSEHTAALETLTATAPTPTGSETSGKEWWITSWRYFVAYQKSRGGPEVRRDSFRGGD